MQRTLSDYFSTELRWIYLTSSVPSVLSCEKWSIFQTNLMTFLFSPLRKTSLFIFIFLFFLQGMDKCICSFCSAKFIYILGMHLKGLLSKRDGFAHFGLRGANVWKKAWAGDSAQSSRECCGSRNIRSLKCFLKHFLKRHQDLSLSFFSPSFIPVPQIYLPLSFIPKLHLTYSVSVLIPLCVLLRDQ